MIYTRRFSRNAGFYIPFVMILLLIILGLTATSTDSIKGFQQRVYTSEAMLQSELAAKTAIATAEDWLLENDDLPVIYQTVGGDSEYRVWAPKLETYSLSHATDAVSSEPLQWWDQPPSWWTLNTKQTGSDPINGDNYVAIEFNSRLQIGEDIGQFDDYKGARLLVVYKVFGLGQAPRETKTVKQSMYVDVVY